LLGQDFPGALLAQVWVENHEIELAAFAAGDAAHNPIGLGLIFKVQLHFRLGRAGVDDGFIAPAGFPVKGVSNGIQQRGFPGTIGTRDARQVKAGEINLDRLAVGSESGNAQLNRYHRHQTLTTC